MTPGNVTATASQLPVGKVRVTVLSSALIGSRIGVSSETDGAFRISNESREIFFRPSGESGSTFKVRTWSPSAKLVNSPINAPFSVAPAV